MVGLYTGGGGLIFGGGLIAGGLRYKKIVCINKLFKRMFVREIYVIRSVNYFYVRQNEF